MVKYTITTFFKIFYEVYITFLYWKAKEAYHLDRSDNLFMTSQLLSGRDRLESYLIEWSDSKVHILYSTEINEIDPGSNGKWSKISFSEFPPSPSMNFSSLLLVRISIFSPILMELYFFFANILAYSQHKYEVKIIPVNYTFLIDVCILVKRKYLKMALR